MKNLRNIFIIALLAIVGVVSAQEVRTLYFLENAPMRTLFNPAFQPLSNGYINFSPLGYSSLWLGNNSLTISDLLFKDPLTGKTITPLHPNADRSLLMKAIRNNTLVDVDGTLNILGFGGRCTQGKGYFNVNLMLRANLGLNIPKSLTNFLLNGGMDNIHGVSNISLGNLGLYTNNYWELGIGYSYQINDQWTVGGKLKALAGIAYANIDTYDLSIDASTEELHIYGSPKLMLAAPVNFSSLPDNMSIEDIENLDYSSLIGENIFSMLKPSGYGAAVDLGVTYQPLKQLQISASVTDLGFIVWNSSRGYSAHIDTTFTGVDVDVTEYIQDGTFNLDQLSSDAVSSLKGLLTNGLQVSNEGNRLTRMVNAKLNIGVDGKFWDNRIGVGILSQTRFYNRKVYEEVTLGAALRPCNWFNLAVSYSLLQNGKYSNIGAGLSFMPYDGINLTLAMDYIPTTYIGLPVEINGQSKDIYALGYKTKGMNVALGFSIVWGTNKNKNRDSDRDGVYDKLDMCPNTPKGVKVDELGCPIDSDGDGVPDYLDLCPNTHPDAYGWVNESGCTLDTDGDGIDDYNDECPNTPAEAYGLVDEKGCPLDTDEDGVPDYKDECPDTPREAAGFITATGCLMDTDEDGVPDYLDECPGTPVEAQGYVDEKGCPMDSDHDSVPDYMDECPNTPAGAIGYVDEKGCELDSDGDNVPDWCDQCPQVAGLTNNKGCPEIKREIRNLLNKAMQGIQFENGKATIKKNSYPLLDQIANIFIENTDYIIEVQGHTDNTGSYDMNMDLSERRANAVMNYLVQKGVPTERISAKGYGPNVPIADNKTSAGRAKNRRVEFNITFEEITYETILEHAE